MRCFLCYGWLFFYLLCLVCEVASGLAAAGNVTGNVVHNVGL
jgi:hypothetical protein